MYVRLQIKDLGPVGAGERRKKKKMELVVEATRELEQLALW